MSTTFWLIILPLIAVVWYIAGRLTKRRDDRKLVEDHVVIFNAGHDLNDAWERGFFDGLNRAGQLLGSERCQAHWDTRKKTRR